MNWVCPQDRTELVAHEERLSCPQCSASYPVDCAVPRFGGSKGVGQPTELLEALWQLALRGRVGDAIAQLCKARGFTSAAPSEDWRFFLPRHPEKPTLEIGAGLVRTQEAPERPAGTLYLVPHPMHGRLLRRALDERGDRAPIAVIDQLSRLPLADRSVGAIAVDGPGENGFRLPRVELERFATEMRRIIVDEGTVFLGVPHSLQRLIRGALPAASGRRKQPIDIALRAAMARGALERVGVRRCMRTMIRCGFEPTAIYAPLPDPARTQVVIPLGDPNVVRYFLDNLIRKNALLVRAALKAANLSVRLGVFSQLMPHYYLFFRAVDRAKLRP